MSFLTHAIVPARQGSKGFPHKNIASYRGKPLLVWSIELALACTNIDEVFISTDSTDYEELAIQHGASSIGLRPETASSDRARDILFLQHHLSRLSTLHLPIPSTLVILRPTSPDRSLTDLSSSISFLHDNFSDLDSIRSVSLATETPYKMWTVNPETKLMHPLLGSLSDDQFNSPRQDLPSVYWQNGQFDVIKSSNLHFNSVLGDRVYPWITSLRGRDIDLPSDIAS